MQRLLVCSQHATHSPLSQFWDIESRELASARDTMHWLTIAVDRGFINHPFLARHDPCFETLRS